MNKRIKKKHRKQKLMQVLRKAESLNRYDGILITGYGTVMELEYARFTLVPSIRDKSEIEVYATLGNVSRFGR